MTTPDKTTQNAVRQVLMNELGLTRESIRQEAQSIVRDTIERKINETELSILIGLAVEKHINALLRPMTARGQSIPGAIYEAILEVARKWVNDNVEVSIKDRESNE